MVIAITVRGVEPRAWKEFQRGIVGMHGNLYGNIGQEVTNALGLWLERYRGWESAAGTPSSRLAVSYEDVGGLKGEIEMMKEAVEMPLRHPELLRWLDIVPPKGVLIFGPQGTGKNLLAKAAAAEAGASLFILKLSPLMTEPNREKLRGVFEKAKETAPSVILLPDLRALALGQEAPGDQSGQIALWLISEMEGLGDFSSVIVVGIASSPEEIIPGLKQMFQRTIEVGLPDKRGRQEILSIQTKNMPLADDVDLNKLADLTDGHPGIFIRQICQEAAMQALRRTINSGEIPDGEIPQEKLEVIKVGMDDFLRAVNSHTSEEDTSP